MQKTAQETQIEMITAGVLVILLALFLLTNISDSLVMTLAGVVLLGSGMYQSSRGWHVAMTTWLLAVVLVLGGIGVRLFLVATLAINWVAIALVLIGAYILWNTIMGKRGSP
jgi:hypothetical protein